MTEQLYLHVGAPKSGTTYLQRILESNRDLLGRDGVLVVGRTHLERVHAAMVVREDPRLADLGPRAAKAWQRLVEELREWSGPKAVLSYELFAGASLEQAERALADLDGIEVHVIVTARDLGRSVSSAWQERLKFALTTPLEQWRPRPEEDGPRAEWGWRTLDPAGVAARWGAGLPADRVHVVTAPRPGTGGQDSLWQRFAEACGLDASAVEPDVERANESMGVVAAELLRRVNEHLGPPFDTSREQAVWLRDVLAHQVLVPLGAESIGITEEQLAQAQARSVESIARIREAGYAVHGDLEDLHATAPDARTPAQVSEGELLDTSLETVVALLTMLRETRRSGAREVQAADAGEGRSLKTVGKRLVQRAVAPPVRRAAEALEVRVEQLEEQLQEQRALQLRVAELTDLVTELLLPAGEGVVSDEALATYRGESL